MTVRIFSPDCDARLIDGFTVVVDVLRAFSVSYFIAEGRPKKYIVLDSVERAFELRREIPDAILIGERQGIKIPGFDFGNSPTEIEGRDFSRNVVIHTTTAGTRGLVAQKRSNEVVAGSFVNARAIADYARGRGIETVNVYCTAPAGKVEGEEDYRFAEYLRDVLLGNPVDFPLIVEKLKTGTGRGFREGGFAPYSDFERCMELDRFDSILRVAPRSEYGGTLELETVPR